MCRHNFIEIERFYAEPSKLPFENVDRNTAEKLLMGVTTIIYKCNVPSLWDGARCGDIIKQEIVGKSLNKT